MSVVQITKYAGRFKNNITYHFFSYLCAQIIFRENVKRTRTNQKELLAGAL